MPAAGCGFEQATTLKLWWPRGACWSLRPMWSRRRTTSSSSSRCWTRSRLCPNAGRGRNAFGGRRLFQRGECRGLPEASLEPLIAMGRQPHHPPLGERFAKEGPAPENPTPVEAMAHRLKTPEGRKLYALRKQTPEPVFGIIKSALGFRQFSLRGLDKVRGEWSLVTMAWNLKRMFVLAPADPAAKRLGASKASVRSCPNPALNRRWGPIPRRKTFQRAKISRPKPEYRSHGEVDSDQRSGK